MHVLLLCLATAASVASAHNVLQLSFSKQTLSEQQQQKLRLARRNPLTVPLSNQITSYLANVTIGTPPQQLQLLVDTGSSDIWVISSAASYCPQTDGGCPHGTFNADASTSFTDVEQGTFEVSYADNTGAQGDYFTDVLQAGAPGSQVSVGSQIMGIALTTDQDTGIMGIGFPAGEAECSQSSSSSGEQCQTYPTFTQNLVSQGVINSQAYSLWLDDLDSNTGSVLFGGVDTKKYVGNLITIPIYPDSNSNEYTSFTVAWTGLTMGTPDGPKGGFVADDFAQAVLLDSGTSITYVPEDVAQLIYNQFDAQPDQELGGYVASCSLGSSTATFDFQFGGPQGPVISVPVSELLVPVVLKSGKIFTDGKGQRVCTVGVESSSDDTLLFGETILRSAYVVYDLDNMQISMAQTNFDSTESSIQEIRAGQDVPGAQATASFRSVAQTATVLPGAGGPNTVVGGGSSNPTLASGAPLAQYTAKNTYNPHPIASHAAGVRQAGLGSSFGMLDGGAAWVAVLGTTFVALGGGLLLL